MAACSLHVGAAPCRACVPDLPEFDHRASVTVSPMRSSVGGNATEHARAKTTVAEGRGHLCVCLARRTSVLQSHVSIAAP